MNELRTPLNQSYGRGLQIATKAGNLCTIRVHNKSASTVYLQLHDAASTPADGTIPSCAPVPIPAATYYESDTRFDFINGLYVCGSSTDSTKSIITADDFWISAQIEK